MDFPSAENDQPGDSTEPSDCFAPPQEPCECHCLHCHRVFMSDAMWFQRCINGRDGFDGFWMCPTPNCSGAGFTFDIFPTDDNHPANAGWTWSDDGSDDSEDDCDDCDEDGFCACGLKDENNLGDDEDEDHEYDPAEPQYARFDQLDGESVYDEADLEGEEWKLGLAPGERPPEPDWAREARQRYEQDQERYDMPDQRPRVRDMSKEPPPPPRPAGGGDDSIDESDIPF